MPLRGLVPVALAVIFAAALASPSRPAAPQPWTPSKPPHAKTVAPAESASRAAARPPGRPPATYDGVPDTGQFLPDSAVIARVNDRTITVGDYIASYFDSYAEFRPRPDSAGRVEFLNSMLNKEVLGITARGINRPMGFEDRSTMREHTQRVLSNILYQRAVVDSVTVTEEETRLVYEEYRYQQHMRHIQFADRATAEKVRQDLVAGRNKWDDAVRRYSLAEDRSRGGDLGWKTRVGFDPVLAEQVYTLKPGEYSPIVMQTDGYHLFQSIERKDMNPPAYEGIRPAVRGQIRAFKTALRTEAMQSQLRAAIGMTYDTTNITWASAQFGRAVGTHQDNGGPTIEFNTIVPEFAPADTGRVLARHRYGQFTLRDFMNAYTATPPLLRSNVNDFESMRHEIDGDVLEPYMAEMAVSRGLDKDPLAIRYIESRREQMMVEHLYQDSILSRVWVKPEERRKYYKDHLAGFVTFPRVRYAAFARDGRASADSLAAELRAGRKAEDVLRADSLLGLNRGSIQERRSNEEGTPFYKLLFEELRPGQVSIEGPDQQGGYAVLQLLSFDPGRQLSYEESSAMIDESLQNIHSEAMLKAFLARLKKRMKIEAHFELLDRVRLVDPTLTWD